MDMLCFDVHSARQLVEALRGEIQLLVHCGTIWVHGYASRCRSPKTSRATHWKLTGRASAM
jgi:hypothetical protein